jgi:curved DNA-binding protein CbpA
VIPDYCALLNVVPDADHEIVPAAYLVLAKRYHPDMAAAASPHNGEKFQLISEAYEVLRDPNRRTQYDRHHARQRRYLAQREKFENARRRSREQAQAPSALRNPLIFSVGGFALGALVFGLMHTEKFERSSSLLSDKVAQNQELADLRQALQQTEGLAATYQELLAQERARSLELEGQLAARRDATPARDHNAMPSLSQTPDPTQAPETDKLATALLPTSDKSMTPTDDRPATAARSTAPEAVRPTVPEAPGSPEAARLMARASLLLDQGNISVARAVLERAAEMGSAPALFALAETYDRPCCRPGEPSARKATSARHGNSMPRRLPAASGRPRID